MKEVQPSLIKNIDKKSVHTGPIFEFGEGWGTKTKKWFKKYILGGECALCRGTRYVFLAGIILLIFAGPQLRNSMRNQPQDKLLAQATITETVQTADSKIKVARRALANYLYQSPDTSLTNGQKVYIETVLGQDIDNAIFRNGVSIEFATDSIKSAIEKSKGLTASQLQRWETAAKGVRF